MNLYNNFKLKEIKDRVAHRKSETHLNLQLQHQLSSYTMKLGGGDFENRSQLQIEAVMQSSYHKG